MPARPQLKPYYRVLRRAGDSLQLGTTGDHGAIAISGLTPGEMRLVEQLDARLGEDYLAADGDGSGVGHRLRRVLAELGERGMLLSRPRDRADLAALPEPWRQVLEPDAQVLAIAYPGVDDGCRVLGSRRRQHVAVRGDGELPYAIASSLRGDGLGRVDCGSAAVEALAQDLDDPAASCPDLVVLVAERAVDSRDGLPWLRRAVPVLPVVVDGPRVAIGPLIGTHRGAPCLRCLDMHRADRDPRWPMVLAQLIALTDTDPPPQIDTESSLTRCAAAMAAMIAHSQLDGWGPPDGVSVEVALPFPRTVLRHWARHPRCRCHLAYATGRPA